MEGTTRAAGTGTARSPAGHDDGSGLGEVRRVHFVGIGGVGMSAIAQVLLQSNYVVSGSDLHESPALEHLRSLGGSVFVGHRPSNVGSAEAVVFSSAVSAKNPELEAARRRKLPILHRAEMLAHLMRSKQAISIAGTHGKTTTTALTAALLLEGGLDPTVLVGARVEQLGGNARVGQGDYLVAEADESDGSFLKLSPRWVVVTNIDTDHLDYYGDLEHIKKAFLEHISRVPLEGGVIACRDDPNLRQVLKKVHRRVITYGLEPGASVSAQDVVGSARGSEYSCLHDGQLLGRIQLGVPGRHNVVNSLAAIAVGLLLDVPFSACQRGLKTFSGVERRLEWKGEKSSVRVLDDYGHHPSEIQATLQACTGMERRLLVVFQPHRFSRTHHLMSDLAKCFGDADQLFVMDIYAAGEEPIPGVSSRHLVEQIGRYRQVAYADDRRKLVEELKRATRPGDLLLTLGAGDVWKIGEAYLED